MGFLFDEFKSFVGGIETVGKINMFFSHFSQTWSCFKAFDSVNERSRTRAS
jgi:hypothetical protein